MSNNKQIGDKGENLAVKFLQKRNYTILHRNWRYRRAEVDIIALDAQILVFIEVKTRAYTYYGNPENFVSKRKIELMVDAARAYMEKENYDGEIRFDIISVLWEKGKLKSMEHFEDAFFPGLDTD